jgi:hypothetical protein
VLQRVQVYLFPSLQQNRRVSLEAAAPLEV